MKKRLLLSIAALALTLTSCEKEQNFIFDIVSTTVTNGAGGEEVVVSFTEIYCTEQEAEEVAKRLTTRSEVWVDDILVTIDTKARYQMCRGASGHPTPPKKQGGSRY